MILSVSTICGVDTMEQIKVETADEVKSSKGLIRPLGTSLGSRVEFAARLASCVLVVWGKWARKESS